VKLVLFQTAPNSEISPGVLTDRGIVDISAAVKKSYTPQLDHARHYRRIRAPAPRAG
jgi:hypothetical protein